MWAADLFTVPTLTFKALYVLVFIAHGRRQLVHGNVPANPTAAWVWQQAIGRCPGARGRGICCVIGTPSTATTFVTRPAGSGSMPSRHLSGRLGNGVAERVIG